MSTLHSPAYRALMDRLVAARLDAGLTQVELADRIGRSQSFVTKIENCQRRLDVIEFVAIANAIGSDWAKLIEPGR